MNRLNHEIRTIRVKRGELRNELEVDTVRGKFMLGAGDRIQFHGNARNAGIYNGSLATVERIEGTRVKARTDTGRGVQFDTATFRDYGLGYAGSVNSHPTMTPFSRPILTPLGAQDWAYPGSA